MNDKIGAEFNQTEGVQEHVPNWNSRTRRRTRHILELKREMEME